MCSVVSLCSARLRRLSRTGVRAFTEGGSGKGVESVRRPLTESAKKGTDARVAMLERPCDLRDLYRRMQRRMREVAAVLSCVYP